MGLFDKFTTKKDSEITDYSEGLPDMQPKQPTLSESMQKLRGDTEFRSREKERAASTAAEENDGLPSVNRRKGGNKLVTALGFVFIAGAAAAMIFAVNGEKKPRITKPAREDTVTNNLPPLSIPPAPPPIPVAQPGQSPMPPSFGGNVPPIKTSPPPHPLHSGTQNGKPPLEWTDRKMLGNVLVNGQNRNNQPPQYAQTGGQQVNPNMSGSGVPQGGFGGMGSTNELSAKLEPTITRGVSASLLPDRNFLVTKGTSLDCALETALNSSVPGITTCRLTRDVYSDNGQVLLLDRGSQLVGEYQSGLKQGQVRLFVLWTRAKTPHGVVVSLNSPGTDALGRSGLEGWVDNHFAERFGAAILMSLISDAVAAASDRGQSGGTTNYYGSVASGGEKIIEKILDSTVNIPPTIVKNQGDHIQVMVARDLDFSGVYDLRAKQ